MLNDNGNGRVSRSEVALIVILVVTFLFIVVTPFVCKAGNDGQRTEAFAQP
jgi:hypothetical protein